MPAPILSPAVHDVSLDVQQGEFVSIIEPSGCGKTTILNMIAGFIPHTGGEILLDGRPVKGQEPTVAWCFNRSRFSMENRAGKRRLRAKDRGVGKAEREKIAHEYLALARLTIFSRTLSHRTVGRHAAACRRSSCAGK